MVAVVLVVEVLRLVGIVALSSVVVGGGGGGDGGGGC
jgi:hypothetical protein